MLFVNALMSEYNYACSAPHCSVIGKGGGSLCRKRNIGAYSPFARILIYAPPTSLTDVDQS